MAKRRGNGEGSIYRRAEGRWAGCITVEGGKRKTIYGRTRKEVQELMKTTPSRVVCKGKPSQREG